MQEIKKGPRALMLICFLALCSSCSNKPKSSLPVWTQQEKPQILPLPQEAKQKPPPPECSPTCSERLQEKLNVMLQSLTNAIGPG
ncbi:hypothetical protein SB6423_00584 [Klebsiella pasteurii]|nr:hypothetical protein SB6423_00584 [Klebsiella pasteurii]